MLQHITRAREFERSVTTSIKYLPQGLRVNARIANSLCFWVMDKYAAAVNAAA